MTQDDLIRMARDAGFSVRDETIRTMHSTGAWVAINEQLVKFAALVAAQERNRITAQLVSIGDGYGVRDKGLSEKTYSLMQQTAYEHAAVVMTNGAHYTALSHEELSVIRARENT